VPALFEALSGMDLKDLISNVKQIGAKGIDPETIKVPIKQPEA